MLLRRVTKHVKDQNWFAVGIDFIIVVVGVFIGLQVANWNDAQASNARETELLVELKSEIESSMRITEQKAVAIGQVVSAGKRSLDFIASDTPCENECWSVLVDFFHASQWQPLSVNRSTYDEMRRQGLPRSREIVDVMQGYLSQNATLDVTNLLPAYRTRVRQMIPVEAQGFYWVNCYDLEDGAETYVLDCPQGISSDLAAAAVERITKSADIDLYLTEWTGLMWTTPTDLRVQNETAERALAAVNAELARR